MRVLEHSDHLGSESTDKPARRFPRFAKHHTPKCPHHPRDKMLKQVTAMPSWACYYGGKHEEKRTIYRCPQCAYVACEEPVVVL